MSNYPSPDQNPYAAPAPASYPSMTPAEERNWGVISHVVALGAMLLSAGLLGFAASLIIYLMYKDKGPFVRQHAANSLNIQITMGIVMLVSLPLMLVLVGFITYPLAILAAAVLHIMGSVKANNGDWFNPPMTPRFVR